MRTATENAAVRCSAPRLSIPQGIGVMLCWLACHPANGQTGLTPGPEPSQVDWNCDWIVDINAQPPYDFTHIQEAVASEAVKDGDTICVRAGTYPELVFAEDKKLYFRAEGVEKPVIAWPDVSAPEGEKVRHFKLNFGGGVRDFVFQGPGTNLAYQAEGLAIFNPTVITGCVLTNYSVGFLGFCAANAVDQPSRFARNVVAGNAMGISSGDKEHIYEYNLICSNRLGVTLASGSQARILNNVICGNETHGIKVDGFETAWSGTSEIANNTIVSNGVCGIYMIWLPGNAQANDGSVPVNQPVCPSIHNNIIAFNGGYAIDANTRYGPITVLPADSDQDPPTCRVSDAIGGCYPRILHNVLYANQAGLEPKDDPLNQFWWDWLLGKPGDPPKRIYRVPDPIAYGGRQPNNRYQDPLLIQGWLLAGRSPCIDRGDLDLRPGYTQQGPVSSTAASPIVLDTGRIDIGYHHPLADVVLPSLGIATDLTAAGKPAVRLTVSGVFPGDVITLMSTDSLGADAPRDVPLISYELTTSAQVLADSQDGILLEPYEPQRYYWIK